VDRAHRLHELIPGSTLTVVENAGHLIQLDQPEALTAALTEWLTSPTRGPAHGVGSGHGGS
jgi:pimeloyl-ACP methyl ester carboxylesterase